MTTLFNSVHKDAVLQFRWCAYNNGYHQYYARCAFSPKKVKQFGVKTLGLHAFITGSYTRGTVVDHKNRDSLNNLDDNLVETDRVGNTNNCKLHVHNKSGVSGIFHDEKRKFYLVSLNKGKRLVRERHRVSYHESNVNGYTQTTAFEEAKRIRFEHNAAVGCKNGDEL